MKLIFAIVVALLLTAIVGAQDPTKVAPDTYKLQFENDWVKILRVKYAPHTKVPMHDHSRYPAAYVYLSDSGPIRFIHADWDDPFLERPATKARSFRLSPTTQTAERHEVENPGDLASEFLRIEFKKLKQGQDLPHRRVPPIDVPTDRSVTKVEFESDLIRITRSTCIKGKPLIVNADNAPAMFVVLSAGAPKLSMGEVIWLDKGQTREFNAGDQPLELLRFDMLKATQGK